jgi:pyrimidine deaminase RibD-like protein
MIRSEILEHFILGFGLAIPDNDLGRPTNISQLEVAASETCGNCHGELFDALYNLHSTHAKLRKYVAIEGGFQSPVSFERVRNTPKWKDFFTHGSFNVKVLPAGRIRFERLDEQVQQLKVAQPALDDHKFARMAIEEARKSVSENDERVHPRVGAVVVKDGKALSTAHRGEQPGNHAEFVALEKKLSDEAVAGATVYTTLEPCTTRTHPKIPCAERLIERRVARVVIGMLDPDDRISGKGVRNLRKAGIETVLFPHDLALEVEELNREFTRFCEQKLQTEVGSINKELWKEVAALRQELTEFKQSTDAREREKTEFENLPISFVLGQGWPGNYLGNLKNDSKYQVSVESVQILRGDVSYESPLTEAVKPRPTDDWVVGPGQVKSLSWGPQYEPTNMLRSLVQSSDPKFPQGRAVEIVVSVTFTAEGKRLNKKFVRQVLIQGSQMLPWGPS